MNKITNQSRLAPLFQYISPAIACALFSALSTFIIVALSGSINADATQYLIAADTFKLYGWDEAENIYSRPFYPALIGTISEITHTSSFFSAHLLNIGLLALLGYAFVHAIKNLGGDNRAQWIGAVVLIIFPTLSDYRDYLVRDFGYWAFMLLGFSALVRYQTTSRLIQAGQWYVYTGLATLFRPEAALLLVFVPLALLLPSSQPPRVRLKQTVSVYGLLTLSLLVGLGVTMAAGLQITLKDFELAISPILEEVNSLTESLPQYAHTMATEILNRHSKEHAALGLALVLAGVFFATLLSALTPVIVLVSVYLWKRDQLRWPRNTPYLTMHLILAAILIGFLLAQQFLQARYMLLTALLLLIPFCIGLSKEFENITRQPFKKWIFLTITAVILLDNHISLNNHDHEKDSLTWLKEHSTQDDWIYTNDHQLAYFSNLNFNWPDILFAKRHLLDVKSSALKPYNFIAINIGRKDKRMLAFADSLSKNAFIKRASFSNNRGDQVIIFESPEALEHRDSLKRQSSQSKAFRTP